MIARVVAVLVALGSTIAYAQPKPAPQAAATQLSVFQIRAHNDTSKPSDAELTQGELGKKLGKGPFKAWKRFNMAAPKQVTQLQQLKAFTADLVTGKLSVLYRSRTQSQGKRDRLKVSLTMDDKQGKRSLDTTLELDAGDWFLVGGHPLDDGATFILAISVR
jgi:hypothetical protein